MSDTRQAIESLAAAVLALSTGRPVNLPEVPASRRAVAQLNAAEAAAALPAEAVLEATRRRILSTIRETGSTDGIDRRDLRDGCWLLWDPKDPLARHQGLLDAVLEQAARLPSTRRNLIEAWLRYFHRDGPGISDAGRRLAFLIIPSPDPRLEVWRRAERDVSLFDNDQGPRKLAAQIVRGTEPVTDLLERFGLTEPMRAASGYMMATQEEVLKLALEALRGRSAAVAMRRMADFLAPEGGLRFKEPVSMGAMARGLLSPWLVAGTQPAEGIRHEVQSFLLTHLKDPRLRPAHWKQAGEEAVALIRRWVARASLSLFFDLIGQHARDNHWRYREAFWSAYLDHGAIDDVWLAFGSKVLASARAEHELGGAYGSVTNTKSNHAVLLLKIGQTVYCEWSDDGALRAWDLNDRNAPRLGQVQTPYSRAQLTQPCLPFPPNPETGKHGSSDGSGLVHRGSDRGRWQGSASRLIAMRGGPRLVRTHWMPR